MQQILIQTAFLGDLLLSIPLLKSMRVQEPAAKIHLVCRKGLGDFFLRTGLVDFAHEIDKSKNESYRSVARSLSTLTFSKLYCPHQSLRSALLARALKSEFKLGFRTWWNFIFFDKVIDRPMALPDALRQLALLVTPQQSWTEFKNTNETQSVHFDKVAIPTSMSMELKASTTEQEEIRNRIELPDRFIVLAPGSIWATKRWPYFAELAGELGHANQAVVLIGGPDDVELCGEISKLHKVTNLAGKTSLYESYLILTMAQHLFCNDSGVMHLGAVANVQLTTVFGPTTLSLGYRPWTSKASVVQVGLGCRPCGAHGHMKCPIGTHECMRSILPSAVLNKLNS